MTDKAPNLTGKVFGRLKVIERAESSEKGQSRWKCNRYEYKRFL